MGYHIDIDNMSIEQCREKLSTAGLVPSRMPIRENIDQHFAAFAGCNIRTAGELLAACKTKPKLQDFVKQSGVPEDYLVLLIRELKSWLPNPEKIVDLPGVPAKLGAALKGMGITNTKQLYDRLLTSADRAVLARNTGCDEQDILRLARLTDLVRIRWVNHTFAGMLLGCGYDTLIKVANADPVQLHADIKKLNDEQGIFKGNIGLNDMKLCIQAAQEVPVEIVY